MRRTIAAAAGLLLLLTACSDDGAAPTSTTVAPVTTLPGDGPPVTTASDVGVGDLGSLALGLEEIAQVPEAIVLAARPSSPNLYVAGQDGKVRIIKATTSDTTGKITYQLQTTPLLDLSDDVLDSGERGFLGLAFSSDGRQLFVDYTAKPDGHTVVAGYELGDRPTVDKKSRRQLLSVDQPFPNHNGGDLVMGPDGYLYIGLGDGGSQGDPDRRAQDKDDLLGKILRIDPEGGTEDGPAYVIPPGNPFADQKDRKPEVWLYGVRNPWRFSFDRETGDLWIGDVGQNKWEEIDRLPSAAGFDAGKSANLGWSEVEASHAFNGDHNPGGATLPIWEYPHNDTGGCAVIGGFVYRGPALPDLVGTYLYADNCRTGIDALQIKDGQVVGHRHLDLPFQHITSFGEDRDGELFVLGDGKVVKLVPPADAAVDKGTDG